MAKLKARGREEIFRVARTRPGHLEGVKEVVDYRALTSDNNVLGRMVIYYTDAEVEKNYGERSHDYGWKVLGRAKSGVGLEALLKSYLDKGWQLEKASPAHFRVTDDTVEALSSGPLITAEAAERRKTRLTTSRARAASKRAERAALCDGPGFYVTNNYLGSVMRPRIADHERPFETLEEAVDFAAARYARFTREFNFQYLLPIVVIESPSRQAAVENIGHVWWIDNKHKGPPIDPNQASFNF